MDASLTIGQVAKAASLNPSAIRYYERTGILPEPARVSGKRRYSEDILQRLAVLDVAKQAGFSLDDIRVLFEATDGGAPAHTQLKALADRKLPEVDALIARAKHVRGWLRATNDCTCESLPDCSLFDEGFPRESCS